MTSTTHIRDALRWTNEEPADWASMLAAGLGMAAPLTLAAAYGDLSLALAGCVGSLLMGNGSSGRTIADLGRNELKTLLTLAIAVAVVALVAEHGAVSDAAIVLIAGGAALVGGYSRQLSVSTGRFIIFLCLTFSAASGHAAGPVVFTMIGLIAVWTSGLIFLFGAAARVINPPMKLALPTDLPSDTPHQLSKRWFASLKTLKGWQFPLRVVICLGIAVAIATAFPTHRFFWIALTVALVCQRPLEPWPLRTTQRAAGTLIGVIFASLLVTQPLPTWALIMTLSILSALRLGLRTRNYLLYSAFMTPVVMLILDAGRPIETTLLTDRLIATFIGAALVVGVNRAMVAIVQRRA